MITSYFSIKNFWTGNLNLWIYLGLKYLAYITEKWSDRRPFIVILDWMLVDAVLIMWMSFSTYPFSCKSEKVKPQSTLSKALRESKDVFIHFIWHINYITNNRNSMQKNPFSIPGDQFSLIIVILSKVFCIWFSRISV